MEKRKLLYAFVLVIAMLSACAEDRVSNSDTYSREIMHKVMNVVTEPVVESHDSTDYISEDTNEDDSLSASYPDENLKAH